MDSRLRCMLAVALFGASACEVTGTVGGAAVAASESSGGTNDLNDLETSSGGDSVSSSSDAPDRSTDADTDAMSTASSSGPDLPDDTHPEGKTSSSESSSSSEIESSSGESSSDEDTDEPPDASSSTSSSTEGTDVGELAVNCCAPDEAPGCGDPELEACVCAQDPYCCDIGWDEACVNAASYGECGDPCGGLVPIAPGGCCHANMLGGYGCIDDDVQSCVCMYDPYCCTQTWDELCVEYVDDYGCGGCS